MKSLSTCRNFTAVKLSVLTPGVSMLEKRGSGHVLGELGIKRLTKRNRI